MNLKKSIYSHTTGKLYGTQYEPVMLISKRGNVLIVEGINGRFPVHCDHVGEVNDMVEPEPEKVKVKPITAKKHKAAKIIEVQTLF